MKSKSLNKRDNVKTIKITFDSGRSETVEIERDKETGFCNYTALFWDTSSIVSILSRYYPTKGVKLTKELSRALKDAPRVTAYYGKKGKIFDKKNIYPGDVTYLWEKYRKDGEPVKLILKSGKSPIKPYLTDEPVFLVL